jgi:tetratricopeptide (TPR) repeat protein
VTTTAPIEDLERWDEPAPMGPWSDDLLEPMTVALDFRVTPVVGPPAPETTSSDEAVPAEGESATGGDRDAPAAAPAPPSSVSPESLRRVQLAKATDDLATGRLEQALDSLEALHVRHPTAPEVRDLLIRVLHQRGLLLYGQGQLQAALDSWSRILAIDPEYAPAREFHRAAETELRAIRATPAR